MGVRAGIFLHLFGISCQRLHLRELQRRSGLALCTIQEEAERLDDMELLVARQDGNRVYFGANASDRLYRAVHG